MPAQIIPLHHPLRVAEQAPAGSYGFPPPERLVEQAPEITLTNGVALVELPPTLLRIENPTHLGWLAEIYRANGKCRTCNALEDAELALSEPQGAA